MYLLIIIFKKSEFMAAQRARPILLNERFLVASGASFLVCSIARAVYIYIYIYIDLYENTPVKLKIIFAI